MSEIIEIDPGHSFLHPGSKREYEYNVFQSECLATNLVKKYTPEIYDPSNDDKLAIGKRAKDKIALISLHLNSFNRRQNYATCCISSKYNKPDYKNIKIASKSSMAIAQAIGLNPYIGPIWPVGVMPINLLVLNAAHSVGCEIAFLVEPFFLDCYVNDDTIKRCIEKSMQALASVLIKNL
jgi:hypothetical protein